MSPAATVLLVAPSPELDALVAALEADGLSVDRAAGDLVVASRGAGGPTAVITIAERDLHDHVAGLATTYGRDLEDPWSGARGLAAVHVIDHLTTDHGGGVNRVHRLALVHDDHGSRFLEERTDDPGPSPAPDGVPHDDPRTFTVELSALAQFLRGQGLDAAAEPGAAVVRVGTAGRPPAARELALDLRPDRYQRWFATKEDEFEAIGGEPRDHAWRLWCRLVLSTLTDGLGTPHRLSFVESPEGEVFLVADADGDEPPEAQYEWSAEPGT